MHRRNLLIGGAAVLLTTPLRAAQNPPQEIAALEKNLAGRIRVAALDTGSGARIAWNSGERFAMCSTFKWILAAAILSRVERGELVLDRHIPFSAGAFLPHSPITSAHAREGGMPVAALCEAAVEVSDNTAANTLLRLIGGPPAVTAYLREIGDSVTRLDRYELALNEVPPGDPRDTTTPDAMLATMNRVLLRDALPSHSRALLISWMKNCQTGFARLRAGLPKGWIVADKTGTWNDSGASNAFNDFAVVWPPRRSPILIVSNVSGSSAPDAQQEAALARIGRIVAATFA